MLTANEAKALVALSDSNITRYLDKIGTAVSALAEQGKSSYSCYVDGLWCSKNRAETRFSNVGVEQTPIQKRVTDELKKLGYGVKWCPDGDPYVPRGLSDDDGKGPEFQNWCIVINW